MKILRSRAKTFVVIGWIFFVVSIPVCLAIGAAAGFDKFYFSSHPHVTLDVYDIKASYLILASGAFAAVASSIALALKFRATASVLVIAIWSTTIAGNQIARSLVKPGPEFFERHVGPDVFLVPWQYVPAGPGSSVEEVSHDIGLSAALCLSNLKGRGDPGCTFIQQLRVLPNEENVADLDLKSWRKSRTEMSPGPDRGGYQSFDLSYTVQASGPTRVQYYFVRLDSNGQLTRLVVCALNDERFCRHHALAGKYWLGYDGDLVKADDALDGKLAALVESWRRK